MAELSLPGWRRQAVDDLRGMWKDSIRRLVRFARSSYHYKNRRSNRAAFKIKFREIGEMRVGYDYRRDHVLLRREIVGGQAHRSTGTGSKPFRRS